MSKALVILSGGQDSTTCLFWAKKIFDELHAITFDYGQRHSRELYAAATVARMAVTKTHEFIKLDNLLWSTSPLITNDDEQLERYASYQEMDEIIGERIEKTFVPMRNALFFTVAANRAASRGITNMVTGVCQNDNANYPDCRRDFVCSAEDMINQALDLKFLEEMMIIHTPLMNLSKADTCRLARDLPGCWRALAYTHTAYDGGFPPTGRDHASILRAHGFEQAGLPDPLVERAWREGLMPLPETPNYDGLRQQKKGDPKAALEGGGALEGKSR